MIKSALILGAGRGIRLGERGRQIPKGFISVGEETLIGRSVRLLAESGIESIHIVSGHLHEHYDAFARNWPGLVRVVYNSSYATTGSYQSLKVGLTQLKGDFLLLESDIIFEKRAIAALLQRVSRQAILVSGWTGAGDEVFVWSKANNRRELLLGMSKTRTRYAHAPFGELAGMMKISDELRCDLGTRHLAGIEHYEDAIVESATHMEVECVKVEDLVWAEIDNELMLERVEQKVWPRLQGPQVS